MLPQTKVILQALRIGILLQRGFGNTADAGSLIALMVPAASASPDTGLRIRSRRVTGSLGIRFRNRPKKTANTGTLMRLALSSAGAGPRGRGGIEPIGLLRVAVGTCFGNRIIG